MMRPLRAQPHHHGTSSGEHHDGYMDSNYVSTAKECGLSVDEVVQLALNSFESSFISRQELLGYKRKIRDYCEGFEAGSK